MRTTSLTTLMVSAAALAAAGLAGTASAGLPWFHSKTAEAADTKPAPVTPTEQYVLSAQTMVKAVNLRITPQGLSENQRRALDQVAEKAAWTSGQPVDVQIVTGDDPVAISAGNAIGTYLVGRDVDSSSLSQYSEPDQPADIVTVNMVFYRAHVETCNQSWENLAKTGSNKPYANFGCALTANLAAQVADPRDLSHPETSDSADASRRSVVLDHYRKGEKTSSDVDDSSKGTISNAIK